MTASSGSDHPRVTVVIPVWGTYAGDMLGRAVASVYAASQYPVHVIVVDNAHEHPITIPAVHVVRSSTRLTLGEARNMGLRAVVSEYVLFLDADDELLSWSIDRYLVIADAYLAMRGCSPVVVTAPLLDGVTGGLYHWPSQWMRRASQYSKVFRWVESFRASFPVNGSLLHTQSAVSGLGFDSDPVSAEDWVFGVSLAWRGRVVFAPEPAMRYIPAVGGEWARHSAVVSQRAQQRCVRRRVRVEPSVPWTARAALPLLWVAHQVDVVRIMLDNV